MGDITGRPKAPKQQVVYVPQYVYTNTTTTPTTGTTTGTTTTPDTTTETPEKTREQNLLSRSRSRVGTILTGFRGILSQADSATQRKTLLGE
ncbi:MAG: hypothetical protein DI551_01060 [Micavibrio aeruginosavorus]|uniref:Uncharacterized protein n=1 Tax=Micavibrio aeruginosavorus TaxID=349221 RepID=A0A2W5Q1T8_9BACT|nr:MAG: hypothetical protein DI551_01060 [Micavibrio aeruginosavorus]